MHAATYSDDAFATSDSSEFSPPAKRANMRGLAYLALMCEWVDVSDRAGAATASAIYKDFGGIGDDNFAEVIESGLCLLLNCLQSITSATLSSPITSKSFKTA